MQALVLSKLDYGNALLSSCKNKVVARLQRLQNRAARIVFQVPRRHSSSPLLASLHWLPIDKRIKFKILLHIYKALNDLSPVYLTECITIHLPSREGLRSSVDTTRFVVPRSTRSMGVIWGGDRGTRPPPTFWRVGDTISNVPPRFFCVCVPPKVLYPYKFRLERGLKLCIFSSPNTKFS